MNPAAARASAQVPIRTGGPRRIGGDKNSVAESVSFWHYQAMTGNSRRIAGWREWVGLAGLGVESIKAKLDTGARTSAIHAFDVESYSRDGEQRVRLFIHPVQKDDTLKIACDERVADIRTVSNPGGRREKRFIIRTDLRLGGDVWPIDLSLTDRDEMGFRLLIGRTAMEGRLMVDPDHSFQLGKKKRSKKAKKRKTAKAEG